MMNIKLPNGIVESMKIGIPVVYEMRALKDATPRFISAVNIINMN
jgi:hypothetical protein